MKKIKVFCVVAFVLFGATVFLSNMFMPTVGAFSSGPPAGFSGAPGENDCNACHSSSPGIGTFTITPPASYVPGQTYQIQVQHVTADTTRRRWGFQLSPRTASNLAAGTLTSTTSFTQIVNDNGFSYIHHTFDGTFGNQTGSATWLFNWTAPATNVGPVTFYAAGNQADNAGGSSGDQIYLTNATTQVGGPTPTPTNTPTATPTNTPTATPTATPQATFHQFSSTAYSVTEAGTAMINITRTGVVSGASTVTFATANGTATGGAACTAGVDYIAVSQVVNFASNETSKTVNVVSCEDQLFEANETVNLSISGSNLGSPVAAVLTINNFTVTTPSPTNTPTATPTNTPTATPTNTPTSTPTNTPTATPTPFPEFDLRISQADSPDPVTVGQPLTYTLTVSIVPTALGGSASPVVRFNFPAGVFVTFNSASGTNGYTSSVNGQVVTFSGGTISTSGINAGTATLTVVLTPQSAGTLTSTGSNVVVDPNNLINESDETNNTAATITTTVTSPAKALFDYDGDRRADLSVYRPSNGVWFVQRSGGGSDFIVQFGASADKIAPADFDGDNKTDIAVYRPSQGVWYVFNSLNSTVSVTQFGLAEDLPVPGDYDGDNRADIAVYRPSAGTWFIQRSTQGLAITQFGANGDVPTPGDYDGDGRNDLVVWRPSNGVWFERRSQLGDVAVQFGASTDKVTPADFDGDNRTDIAVYRPSQGVWYVLNSTNSAVNVTQFGLAGDLPVAGDYDGDNRADIALYRPSVGTWFLQRSTAGQAITQFGLNGDKPTQNAFGN